IDPYKNGYVVLSDNTIVFSKKEQHSYHNKYSVRTGKIDKAVKGVKETKANYATAWIDHGSAPEKASYQYVIYPNLKDNEIKNFNQYVVEDKSYQILQANSDAHIVKNKETSTVAYVVFNEDNAINIGVLQSVSKPSLVMIEEKDPNNLKIEVTNPDLNFVIEEGKENRYNNYGLPTEVSLSIKGKWKVNNKDMVVAVSESGETTTITLKCVNGLKTSIVISK
ncbi:polysaccharide lyase beta-sandwich domain-containing protein, partial [Tamlana sp. 2201CG12-4]|uniref:polysaccharide lyase beta-sandwich domain-containing protein n=1 Tax=Tamlana sp. 2201CG12-4 TaxID=3112582 RepID=UPI002DB670E4